MNLKNNLLIAGLGILLILFAATQSLAGSDPVPPADGTVQGPDVWGVVVINCADPHPVTGEIPATLRVKQIADCNVYTEAATLYIGPNCPVQESNVLYYQLTTIDLHDKDGSVIPGTPIFTKIKNFNLVQGVICSFDVLINFKQ